VEGVVGLDAVGDPLFFGEWAMQGEVLQTLVLVAATAANTIYFVWRLVLIRDSILEKVEASEVKVEAKVTMIKAAMDLQLDEIRREVQEHRVKVAEEYLRKESFNAAMERLERTNANGLEKVEAAVLRLDERFASAMRGERSHAP
jgi:hypothetical protein